MKSYLEKAPQIIDEITKNPERLTKLVLDSSFNSLINEINENYYYWDKVKYLPMPKDIRPEEVWIIAKIRRLSTPFKVQFGKYNFSWFLNGKIQELLHLFDMNIGGNLESRSLIPRDEKNRYLISSIMEEAIASSQIEGAVTTRKKAKEMLRKNTPPKNKSEQMILNNYRTIQRVLQIKDEDLTATRLIEIHRLISSDTLHHKEDEGAFRQSDDIDVVEVITGETVHTPPGHIEIEQLINDLCLFFNTASKDQFIHPIIKGCIIHFMIGYIHPFVDGNGRTARALFYWYLLKNGYWLTEYLSISKLILKSKDQYSKTFIYTETDNNDLTYFIRYKLKTMNLAYKSLREYIQRKLEEKRQVAEFIKLEGINDRQALILKWYYEEPSLLLTVKEVQARIGVANQTARTDLQSLVTDGFLVTIRINKKKEAFIRDEKFDALLKTRLSNRQVEWL